MDTKNLIDEYTLKARVIPALAVILPYIQAMQSPQTNIAASLNSLLINGIFLFIIANVVRDLGAKIQEKLYKQWGGIPSTIILRWRDNTLEPSLKERYHKFLSKHTGIDFPDPAKEASDPEQADKIYSSSVKWLKEQTRDHSKFHLVFCENISYGFWRNLLALKIIGLFVALIFAALSGVDVYRLLHQQTGYDKNLITSVIFCLATLWFWSFCVREKQVKKAAYCYAKTLLAQCDAIKGK